MVLHISDFPERYLEWHDLGAMIISSDRYSHGAHVSAPLYLRLNFAHLQILIDGDASAVPGVAKVFNRRTQI
jgi:hypothetical protein